MQNLRDKTYEEGWLKDHDHKTQTHEQDLRVDLRTANVKM